MSRHCAAVSAAGFAQVFVDSWLYCSTRVTTYCAVEAPVIAGFAITLPWRTQSHSQARCRRAQGHGHEHGGVTQRTLAPAPTGLPPQGVKDTDTFPGA